MTSKADYKILFPKDLKDKQVMYAHGTRSRG
jgi:hypothetical protein